MGRVKIQVYRGPSKGDYDFAPWGYYNTQPSDLQIHHNKKRDADGIAFPKPDSDGAYSGDNYFQYINVPATHNYEWGYRRGKPEYNREEYLSQKYHTFKAKVMSSSSC